ncbi:MAG TPA: NAD(P)-binding domain-containing protein [Micromonosporaceae bacterium]
MANETVDVAIVGAGPYGLSIAAHLRAAGVSHRVFGETMQLWTDHMPIGMYLKSQGFASNLSDPVGGYTLAEFCRATGRPYADYGRPVPLDTFVEYGRWFQRNCAPEVENVLVTNVAPTGDGFEVKLADGTGANARQVVVAIGVQAFAHVPAALSTLPAHLCAHASAQRDLSVFAGRDVVVVGAGQSALETAALLREQGATVRVLVRGSRLVWNGEPLAPDRPLAQRLREPESGLGSGWGTWFYSTKPALFRRLPASQRLYRARTALGPAGSSWLRPRVEGQIPILLRHSVASAEPVGDRVRLWVRAADGRLVEMVTDHVIAATGYRPDAARLSFLDPITRTRLHTVGQSPGVDRAFESSVPGLFVVGPAVAPSFGPVMRFVYGADFAARTVTKRLAARSGRSTRRSVRVR